MGGEREEEGSCIIRSNIVIERNAFNPFNAELNPTCQMLALLGAHHIFHVSRIGDKPRSFDRRFGRTSCIYHYGDTHL